MGGFKGRMNRAWFGLGLGAVILFLVAINSFSGKPASISEVVLIFLAVPRLHDIGKSGWFVLIGVAVEIGGIALGSFFPLEQMRGILVLTTLALFGLMVWLAFIRGEPGPNRWGKAPEQGLTRKGCTHPDA